MDTDINHTTESILFNGAFHCLLLIGFIAIQITLLRYLPCSVLRSNGDLSIVQSLVAVVVFVDTAFAPLFLMASGAYKKGWRGFLRGLKWALVMYLIIGVGWLLALYTSLQLNFCGTM